MKMVFGSTLFAALSIFSSAAFAGEVPDCWRQPNVVPGDFGILIKTKKVSKETLLDLLDRATGRSITAREFPIVRNGNASFVIFYVKAVAGGAKPTAAQKAAVLKELQPFADTDGVSIECNGLSQ